MKIPRIFQLSGEKEANQRLLAKNILTDLQPGEEVTFIVSQEGIAKEIQEWAKAQGLIVSATKKIQEWQWAFTAQRSTKAKTVEAQARGA